MTHAKTVRDLRRMARPGVLFFVILLLTTVGDSLTRYFLAESFTRIINSLNVWSISQFIQYGLFLVIVLVIGGLSSYYKAVISEKTLQQGLNRLQERIIASVDTGSFREVEQIEYGNYHTLMASDSEKIAGFYPMVVFPLLNGTIQFSTALYFVFRNSWELGLILIGISLFSFFVPKLFKTNLKVVKDEVQKNEGFIRTFFSHSLERVGLIKVYESKSVEEKGLKTVHKKYGKALVNLQSAFAKMLGINNLLTYISVAAQVCIEIWFIGIGKLTLGAFLGLSQLSSSINWPFWWMPHLMNEISQTEVSAERVAEFVDAIKEKRIANRIVDRSVPMLKGENLSFAYGKDKVFEDFSFEIYRNEIVGLNWKSGEGKSTLIKLICGLYTPDGGRIVQKKKELCFAYAPQNELFFSDSIKNNVALSESVDNHKLKQAFEKTSVDFLGGEHSSKTQLDKKGQPLSGGQQKRINLARAFYHDSDVLILDEPTASLDKETKSKVLEAIKREKEKRAVILITHDRETYEICDRML